MHKFEVRDERVVHVLIEEGLGVERVERHAVGKLDSVEL